MFNVTPNPLLWLGVFLTLSIGATFADSRHVLDVPRQAAERVVAPIQAGASRIGHAAGDVASGWHEVGRLRSENAALQQTVEELLQETVRLRAADLENQELRDQLRYARANESQAPLPAEVIGIDTSPLLGYAFINQGSEARLEDGMTVLSTAGLVGRIASRTARTSKVLLINHPSSSVNAMIQGAPGARGVVNGQPDGRLRMRYIPQSEPVKVNDIVVTSGLGGAFPANIAIGRVVQVDMRDIDMFQEALVEPYVDFAKLRNVFVATAFLPTKL